MAFIHIRRKVTCSPDINSSDRTFINMTLFRVNTTLQELSRPYRESKEKFDRSLNSWLDIGFKQKDAEILERFPIIIERKGRSLRRWVNRRLLSRNIPFRLVV